jgi:hypothetical protein
MTGAQVRACGKLLILATFCVTYNQHANDNMSIHGASALISKGFDTSDQGKLGRAGAIVLRSTLKLHSDDEAFLSCVAVG